jgi:EAL domain-containing protein (putative c-di-GMP-specific phosphodiesterase class I)
LLKKLVEANFPPQRLEIEITETCLHENIGLVRSMVTSLRNQGIQISLDDFGTGYSSLEHLHNLPFDRIKIDRSFVSELREPDRRSGIVEAIVSLGRGLNLPLTVEGVEDEEILNALKSMGRLKAQGYLYGQPEDAAAVRTRLRAAGQLNKAAAPERVRDTDGTQTQARTA